MSEYDTVEVRRDSIVIKDGANWLIITDEVRIELRSYGNRIGAKANGCFQWFLWTNLELVAKVEKAAKETDGITVNVRTD